MSGGLLERKIRELLKLKPAPKFSNKALCEAFTVYVETKQNSLLEVVAEAKADFHAPKHIEQTKEIVEKLFPASNGFSKRWVLLLLQEYADASKKWFGRREVEQGEKP